MTLHVSGVALCHFLTNWPIIKWDLVDYYGEVKKSYDYVKMCYQPLVPSMQFSKRRWMPGEEFVGELWVVNDYYKTYVNIHYNLEILNKAGKIVFTNTRVVNIGENESVKHDDLKWRVEGLEGEYFDVKLNLVTKDEIILSKNEYRILIADQVKAKKVAEQMNYEMSVERSKYGRGYYRYSPECVKLD